MTRRGEAGKVKGAGERIIESLQEFAAKLERGDPIYGTRVSIDGDDVTQTPALVVPPKPPSRRTYAVRRKRP